MKVLRPALLWMLILCACSPILPSSGAGSQPALMTAWPVTSVPIATTEGIPNSPTRPIPKLLETLQTPHIDQPPDGAITAAPPNPQDCGYQWAFEDLPELSRNLMESIQTIQPGAQATAFGYGENCVHADGSAAFVPMETDFNITLQVVDLTDITDLGEWIVKVMQIIDSLPPDQIVGPRPGRVSITFESNGQQHAISFYIDRYRALPADLSSEEIYQALQAPQ